MKGKGLRNEKKRRKRKDMAYRPTLTCWIACTFGKGIKKRKGWKKGQKVTPRSEARTKEKEGGGREGKRRKEKERRKRTKEIKGEEEGRKERAYHGDRHVGLDRLHVCLVQHLRDHTMGHNSLMSFSVIKHWTQFLTELSITLLARRTHMYQVLPRPAPA